MAIDTNRSLEINTEILCLCCKNVLSLAISEIENLNKFENLKSK